MQKHKIFTTAIFYSGATFPSRMKAAALSFCLFLGISLLLLPAAQAQSVYDVTISPPVAFIKLKPGSKAAHTLSIVNNGSATVTLTPRIVDFSADGETGRPILADDHTFPYFAMASAQMKPLTMDPGAKAQLTLAFSVSASAPDKEYPLSILFESSAKTGAEGTSPVVGTVGSNLIVLVSEKDFPDRKLLISDFGAPKFVDSLRSLTFAPTVKNEQFSAGIASGSATITSWTGKKVAEFDIYPDAVLGFRTRKLRALDTTAATLAATEFSYNPPVMFGPQKLTITLTTPDSSESFSTTIFALPFSLLVAILIGAAIGFGYWYRTKRDGRLTF